MWRDNALRDTPNRPAMSRYKTRETRAVSIASRSMLWQMVHLAGTSISLQEGVVLLEANRG